MGYWHTILWEHLMQRGIIQMDTVFTAATTTLYTKEGMESIHEHLLCVYIWSMAEICATQSQGQELSCSAVKRSSRKKWWSKSWETISTMSVSVHECDWSYQHSSVGNLKCRCMLRPFLPVLRVRYWDWSSIGYLRTYICSASPKPSAQIVSTQAMLPRIPMHISCRKYNRAEITLNTEVL